MAQQTAARVPTDRDYARLLSIRTRLRVFERWSAEQAAAFGLTAAQHQLLLAIRGHADERGPTIGEVASYLLLRHHSAVELANRAQELGFITRVGDADDHRIVRLLLTTRGKRVLQQLSAAHIEELSRLAPMLSEMLSELSSTG